MSMLAIPAYRQLFSDALPEVFAAQFSLSHVAWLITYPIAGWLGTSAGFTVTWVVLLTLTAVGSAAALALWPSATEGETSRPEVFVTAAVGVTSVDSETQSAAGTLTAYQCACVRPG